MRFQIPITNLKGKIVGAVGYTALISFFVLILSRPLNDFLKTSYGKYSSELICEAILKVPEQYRFLFFQLCSSVEDLKITPEEFASILINAMKSSETKTAIKEVASKNETYREVLVKQAVGYGIFEYQMKMKQDKYIDKEKPKGFFDNVYQPNLYNEEQIVLLEQAKYTEYTPDGSYAQEVLGPKRELTYIGLKFPYQGGLTD